MKFFSVLATAITILFAVLWAVVVFTGLVALLFATPGTKAVTYSDIQSIVWLYIGWKLLGPVWWLACQAVNVDKLVDRAKSLQTGE